MNLPDLKKLVTDTRSIRRFREYSIIDRQTLVNLIELARLTPSSMNRQPLKYIIINNPELRTQFFKCLRWAAALKDWDGPTPGERPAAYVLILGDTQLSKNFSVDPGIVALTIALGARTEEIGACIQASIDKTEARKLLNLHERYEILLVVALGKPAETVQLENMPESGNFDYWRDADSVHHVPKRSLRELILAEYTD